MKWSKRLNELVSEDAEEHSVKQSNKGRKAKGK